MPKKGDLVRLNKSPTHLGVYLGRLPKGGAWRTREQIYDHEIYVQKTGTRIMLSEDDFEVVNAGTGSS